MTAPNTGCLFWELTLEEEARDPLAGFGGDGSWYEIVPAKDGDLLIFESSRRSTLLRRFAVASETFGEGQELSLAVHAAVPSPASPEKACLLHCPSHWGSDHRYEVYSLDTSNPDSFPALEPLFVSSASKAEKEKLVEAGIAQIAPKQRHGFSLAPYDCSLYFLCGLQHFPGDVTGSFVYCFSLEEREWTEVEYTGTFPATKPGVSYQGCRFGQSCVVQGHRAWIFGGCVSNEAGGVQPTSGLFSFDLEEHHFEEIAAASPSNWPPALTAHSSVASDGKVFVFGGGDGAQDVYCYDVGKSSWALLPPLLLGPRPCDGRVAHAVADGYVVAYQQTEGSDPASEEPNVGHSLFRITREQLSRRAETSARDFRDRKPEGMSELDFLLDEATADAAFLIDDTRLPVHRAVLRRFAPALAKVVAEKPVVALNGKGVTIPAVQQLLQHVYSRYMDPVSPAEAEMLLKLAHHFQLMPLVQLCQENIVIDASNVRELLDYASRVTPPLETLNQKCYEFWTSHPEHLSFMKSPVRDRLPSNLPTVASPELRAATESEARSTQSRQHFEHLQAHLQQLAQPPAYAPASVPGRSVSFGSSHGEPPPAGFTAYGAGVPQQPAVLSQARAPTVIQPQPAKAMSVQTLPPASARPPLPAQANWRPAAAQPGVQIPGPYAGGTERYYRMLDTGITGTTANASTAMFQRTVS